MGQNGNGIEVGVPGVAYVKGLKTLDGLMKVLLVGAIIAIGVALHYHDSHAAEERKSVAEKLEVWNEVQSANNEKILSHLRQQSEAMRLQTCISFLALPPEQRQRTGRTETAVCGR